MGGLLGGPKGMLAPPPLKLLGGPGPPLPTPMVIKEGDLCYFDFEVVLFLTPEPHRNALCIHVT